MNIVLCDAEAKRKTECRNKIELCIKDKHIPYKMFEYENVVNLFYDFTDGILFPDIIIIDINLCGESAINNILKLRNEGYKNEIIVMTASEEQNDILSGYDIDAIHYIIKEKTNDDKFKKIICKAVRRIENRNKEVITFTCAGESRTIPIKDINYFEVVHRIVTVYFKADSSFSFYAQLGQIEEILRGKGFVRNYRSQIVSIRKIRKYTHDRIVLDNGIELPVGVTHSKDVREAVKRRSGNRTDSTR